LIEKSDNNKLKNKIGSIIGKIPFLHGRLDLHMKEVLSGAAIAFILRVIGAIAQFAFNILVARMLGADGLGIYALAFTASTFASTIGRVGLDQAMMRFIAIHADRQEWGKVKEVFLKGMSIAFITSAIAAMVMFLLAPWISVSLFHKPTLASPMQCMALSVVPFSLINLTAESLRGLKVIHYSSLVQAVLVPIISCVLLFLLVSAGLGINGAILSYVSSTVVVFIIGALLCWRAGSHIWKASIEVPYPTSELLEVSVPMAWVAVMTFVICLADTVILSMFRPASEVGIYVAAQRLAMIIGFIPVAVNSILAPKFAALFNAGELVRLEQLAKNSTRLMLLCAGPLLFLFIFTPGFVMGIYGREFVSGAVPLMLVSLGQLVNVAMGSVGLLLSMTGKQADLRNIMIVSALLNIVLCFALIPNFGILGATISNGIPVVVANIAATYRVKRHLKISVNQFWRFSKS